MITESIKIPTEKLCAEPTPFYFYDMALLRNTILDIKHACVYPDYLVHYAVKANADNVLLSMISSYGFGADTVSGGEIVRALENGFQPEKIVFAGVGKTDAEIELALKTGIGCLNVESEEELEVIESISRRMKLVAPVAIRVNPEVDAHTHHYITTGLPENKFGVAISKLDSIVKKVIDSQHLHFKGLHFHIGSQITSMEPYRVLCSRISSLQSHFDEMNISIPTINVGGGLGIDYDSPETHPVSDFKAYFDTFHNHLPLRPGQQLHFELGRSVVGQCGALIARVTYVKQGIDKKFIILDAGMTDLIRPALYQAHHKIINLTSRSTHMENYDVVGPICESSDTFAVDVQLPETQRGDLIAILSAGAYGQSMASGYNCRQLPRGVYSE